MMQKAKQMFLSLPKPARFGLKFLFGAIASITSVVWFPLLIAAWLILSLVIALIDAFTSAWEDA